jgi:hypothetical protein
LFFENKESALEVGRGSVFAVSTLRWSVAWLCGNSSCKSMVR